MRDRDEPRARPGRDREPTPAGRARGLFRISRKAGRAYQGALEAVLTIPVGLGLGYAADALLGTEPAGVLAGLGLGFGAFVLRVIRLRSLLEAEVARDEGSGSQSAAREGEGGEGHGGGDRWERR